MRRTALLLAALALAACEGRLTDPDAVAERVAERAAANYEGVRDFAVTGGGAVVYFRRTGPDSLFTFESRAFSDDARRQPIPLPYTLPNALQLARGLRGNARLAGTVELDGGRAYVLEASDAAVLIGAAPGPGAGLDSIRVLVDAETFQVREIRVAAPQSALDPAADSTAPPLVQRQRYSDFRTADGLTLPFQTHTLISGIAIPEEARVVQMGMLELQRRQALSLPPVERARALEEVERQVRLIRDGELEESFVVEAVRVNAGVPAEAFAPPPALPAPDTSAAAPAP
jgi:hypothetical protein